ncbi:MAG: Lrp/AsnC family transcriptional regulator [Oscillospiraceae bacterium]|nr:Lrp/AsnC family transcriptional regulator [Oscillospiraceae bacterium]
MDGIDAKLLNILSENSNVTATEITQKVNLSIPAINKRISKLTQRGIIRQFTILVDNKMAGKPIQAFILVVVQPNSSVDKLAKYIQSDPDILECYAVTGEYDYLLKVCAKDVEGLENKLLHLKRQLGVVKSHTMLSLMEHKFLPSALPDMIEKEKEV